MFARSSTPVLKRSLRPRNLPIRALEALLSVWTLPTLMADVLWLWQQRSIERDRLLALDDRMLKDVGLNRVDAHREGRKPFWRG